MGAKTINDIKEILKVIGLDDMDFYFKDWSFILNYVDSKGYTSVFIREVKKLDLNNIDAIDKFLLKTRRMNESDDGEFSLLYGKVLKYSISKAVADSNESLAETVILSLQDKVKDHPELLDYALSISRHNSQMKRVLYNFLREDMTEARSYVGDGSSV